MMSKPEHHIPRSIGSTPDVNYFFTTFNDRLHPLTKLWKESLEGHFGQKFVPIHIVPAKSDCLNADDYYIVLNSEQAKMQSKAHRDSIVDLIYPEDVNKQFSESRFVRRLINKILEYQEHIYIVGFTPVWLTIKNPHVTFLGSDIALTSKLDNKMAHYEVFKGAGLKTLPAVVYKTFKDLKKHHTSFPCFISPSYSSGGIESRIIESAEELASYYQGLRAVNRKHPFIVTPYINNVRQSPNTAAFIDRSGRVTLVSVTDQLLRGNKYMGNIYPSSLSQKLHDQVAQATVKVGEHLATLGFYGFYGLDFIIDSDGGCFPVDLNPRRQGGYYCSVLSSRRSIIDLELRTALGLPIDDITYEDFQVDYAWGHSKLTPYQANSRIVMTLNQGEPLTPFTSIGQTYKHIYYPKDTILVVGNPGFYVTTAKKKAEVVRRIHNEVDAIIKLSYLPENR